MSYALTLHTYDDLSARVVVPNEIVDNCCVILRFEVSGDEVYIFISDTDGSIYAIDASDVVPGAQHRDISCGPENLVAIFPEDMEWEQVYEA